MDHLVASVLSGADRLEIMTLVDELTAHANDANSAVARYHIGSAYMRMAYTMSLVSRHGRGLADPQAVVATTPQFLKIKAFWAHLCYAYGEWCGARAQTPLMQQDSPPAGESCSESSVCQLRRIG